MRKHTVNVYFTLYGIINCHLILNNIMKSMNIIDEYSGNEFIIAQAPGLSVNERALFFVQSPRYGTSLPCDQWLCYYSKQNEIVDLEEWSNREEENQTDVYAVKIKKSRVLLPENLTPSTDNLGLFANGAMKIDPLRQTPNARFTTSLRNCWNNGVRISLSSTKIIHSGEEVIISYGKAYTDHLMAHILSTSQ